MGSRGLRYSGEKGGGAAGHSGDVKVLNRFHQGLLKASTR